MKILPDRHRHPAWSWSVLLLLGQHVSKAADQEMPLKDLDDKYQHHPQHEHPTVYTSSTNGTLVSTRTTTSEENVPFDPLFHDVPPHYEVIPDEGPLAGYDLKAEEEQLIAQHLYEHEHEYEYKYLHPDRHLRSQTDGSPLNPPPEAVTTNVVENVGDDNKEGKDDGGDEYGGEDSNIHIMPYDPHPTVPEYEDTLTPFHTASYGNFLPLECNVDIESAPCDNLSNHLPSNDNEPLVVPCGECYQYDLGEGDASFPSGIRVIGKSYYIRSFLAFGARVLMYIPCT